MPDELNVGETAKTVANMANQVDAMNLSKFYANHAQVNITLFEIRLVMNFVNGVNPENGHLVAFEQLLLSMSPELAKAVHSLLGRALASYTHDYGQLRGPTDAKVKQTQQLDAAARSAMDMAGELSSTKG